MNIGGEKMKVIFLDFDGVINNWNHFNGVDFENVKILKTIINLSGAKVVATTSNKYSLQGGSSIDYYSSIYYNNYVKYLNELGIEIYDITPFVNKDRTLEIRNLQIQEGGLSVAEIVKMKGTNLYTFPYLKRDNYQLLGWYTDPVNGEKIDENTIVPSTDTTYYAHWKYIGEK